MFTWMKRFGRVPPYSDPDFNRHEFSEDLKPELTVFEPRELRKKVIDCLSRLPIRGIINACTGSGKTAMCIEGLGVHLRGKILLWITEFNVVLDSQFTPYNVASWKAAHFIPRETVILDKNALANCKYFPDTCIIYTTIDTAFNHYEKISSDPRFLGFVLDESHHISGDKTFDMIKNMRSNICQVAVGLSATHTSENNLHKTLETFGANPYLVDYTLMEGWRDGIIREVKVMMCNIERIDTGGGGGDDDTLYSHVKNRETLIDNLKLILEQTTTCKGIIWCEHIKEANAWYNYIRDALAGSHPEIRVYIDHTEVRESETIKSYNEFTKARQDAIMITAQKYGEGADIRNLDFAGTISAKESYSEHVFLQRVGRLLRKEGRSGPALYCNFAVTSSLDEYTSQMRNLMLEYFKGVRRYAVVPDNDAYRTYRGGIVCGEKTIECVLDSDGNKRLIFEFLDGVQIADIFKNDAKFAADMMYDTGSGLSFDEIKAVLREHDIRTPEDAQIFFGSCGADYPKIAKWWDIAKYLVMDYTDLLDLDNSQCYKTLEEAQIALRKLEKYLTDEYLDPKCDWSIRYRFLVSLDPKLPIDWQGIYKIYSEAKYWNPNIKKLKRKL
jgi:superfamily II DNA or RNA helicase